MLERMCLAASAALALACIVGCSDFDRVTNDNGDPPPGDTNVPVELIATWTFQRATVNGSAVPLSMLLPWESGTAQARITVKEDETFVFENVDADGAVLLAETGAFTVDDGSFALLGTEDLAVTGTWAVNGDSLMLRATEFGATTVLIATR